MTGDVSAPDERRWLFRGIGGGRRAIALSGPTISLNERVEVVDASAFDRVVAELSRAREAITDALADLTPGISPYSVLDAALRPRAALAEGEQPEHNPPCGKPGHLPKAIRDHDGPADSYVMCCEGEQPEGEVPTSEWDGDPQFECPTCHDRSGVDLDAIGHMLASVGLNDSRPVVERVRELRDKAAAAGVQSTTETRQDAQAAERAEHPDKTWLSRLPDGWVEVPDGLHDYVPVQAWSTTAGWALLCEPHLAQRMYYDHGVEFRAAPELIERARQIREEQRYRPASPSTTETDDVESLEARSRRLDEIEDEYATAGGAVQFATAVDRIIREASGSDEPASWLASTTETATGVGRLGCDAIRVVEPDGRTWLTDRPEDIESVQAELTLTFERLSPVASAAGHDYSLLDAVLPAQGAKRLEMIYAMVAALPGQPLSPQEDRQAMRDMSAVYDALRAPAASSESEGDDA